MLKLACWALGWMHIKVDAMMLCVVSKYRGNWAICELWSLLVEAWLQCTKIMKENVSIRCMEYCDCCK